AALVLVRGAGVAGRDQHLGDARGLGELPCQRMFAAAGADDEDFHGKSLLESSLVGATSVAISLQPGRSGRRDLRRSYTETEAVDFTGAGRPPAVTIARFGDNNGNRDGVRPQRHR